MVVGDLACTWLSGKRRPASYILSHIGFKFSELEMETVLCSLVPAFVFELPKKQIVWNFANVSYPSMGDNPERKMLLKMTSLVQPKGMW